MKLSIVFWIQAVLAIPFATFLGMIGGRFVGKFAASSVDLPEETDKHGRMTQSVFEDICALLGGTEGLLIAIAIAQRYTFHSDVHGVLTLLILTTIGPFAATVGLYGLCRSAYSLVISSWKLASVLARIPEVGWNMKVLSSKPVGCFTIECTTQPGEIFYSPSGIDSTGCCTPSEPAKFFAMSSADKSPVQRLIEASM